MTTQPPTPETEDPETRAMVKGCIVLLAVFSLIACGMMILAVMVGSVGAQSACVYIRVNDGLSANVRSGPGAEFPTVAASLTSASGERLSCEQQNGWYNIGAGQWVSGTYLSNATRRPLVSTRIAPPTLTPTPRATTPIPPTRIPTSTAGPTPTEFSILETAIADERYTIIPFFCTEACEGFIIIRPLPQASRKK